MIRFERLTKRYGPLTAVSELDLEVRAGEVYALLGPNGAGKTTTLRCLASLLICAAGTTWVDRICTQQEDPIGARRGLAFLAASIGLYERLSGTDLITYFSQLQGLAGTHLTERVEAMIDLFGIENFRSWLCGRLSTGQRQRNSLARALVHDPPALIRDEPTRGTTILFSTHQMDQVGLLADRVGVLRDGELLAEGSPSSVVANTGEANLARAFLSLVRGPVPEVR